MLIETLKRTMGKIQMTWNILGLKENKIKHDSVIDIKTVVLEENVKDLFEIHKFCCEIFKN